MTIEEYNKAKSNAEMMRGLFLAQGMSKKVASDAYDAKMAELDRQMKATVRDTPAKLTASFDSKHWLDKFLTVDEEMLALKESIIKLADVNDSVLIYGESGTGKELLARALHGARGDNNFIDLNCAGLPEHLIESELFGHERGAFTGADREKKGLFEEANGGTLFLDELGELPLTLQAKLLRVLQEGVIRRVGANYNKRVRVRIVAATHHSIPALVEEKKFRLDLYARLSTFELSTKPLRNRKDDIKLIVDSLDPSKEIYSKIDWTTQPLILNVRDVQKLVRRMQVMGKI